MKYSMTCTCGDVMSVDADSREEAVAKLKEMMNEEAIADHFAERHEGQIPPSVEQVETMIEESTAEEMA